jgi:hypothetical protein
MSSMISRVASRYKSAIDSQRVVYAWSTFCSWGFKTLDEDLLTLSEAIGSNNLKKKSNLVKGLDARLKDLKKEFTPRVRALLTDPSGLENLRHDLKSPLRFWTQLDRVSFDTEAVWDDVDSSLGVKVLDYDRDNLISLIEEFDNPISEENFKWLADINLEPQLKVESKVRQLIPDYPKEEGTFAYFIAWVSQVVGDQNRFEAEWEDAIPQVSDVVLTNLSETGLGRRLDQLLNDRGNSIFKYIQVDANNLEEDLG